MPFVERLKILSAPDTADVSVFFLSTKDEIVGLVRNYMADWEGVLREQTFPIKLGEIPRQKSLREALGFNILDVRFFLQEAITRGFVDIHGEMVDENALRQFGMTCATIMYGGENGAAAFDAKGNVDWELVAREKNFLEQKLAEMPVLAIEPSVNGAVTRVFKKRTRETNEKNQLAPEEWLLEKAPVLSQEGRREAEKLNPSELRNLVDSIPRDAEKVNVQTAGIPEEIAHAAAFIDLVDKHQIFFLNPRTHLDTLNNIWLRDTFIKCLRYLEVYKNHPKVKVNNFFQLFELMKKAALRQYKERQNRNYGTVAAIR